MNDKKIKKLALKWKPEKLTSFLKTCPAMDLTARWLVTLPKTLFPPLYTFPEIKSSLLQPAGSYVTLIVLYNIV